MGGGGECVVAEYFISVCEKSSWVGGFLNSLGIVVCPRSGRDISLSEDQL